MNSRIDHSEDLAVRAKAGDRAAMNDLCITLTEDVENVARAVAAKTCGSSAEDLAQEGFIILMKLVRSWNPDRGPFRAFFRCELRRELKHSLRGDLVSMPENVSGALRSLRAAEAEGLEVDRWQLASSWSITPAALEAADRVDRDLAQAVTESRDAAKEGDSGLAGVLDALALPEADKALILELRRDGAASAIQACGRSPRTFWRRAHRALSRAAHPCAAA
jgi:RNA polymerase sigma factor (sigma-70 family)